MSTFREDFINNYSEEYLLKLETYILNFLKGELGQGENAKNKGLPKEKFEFLKFEIQKMTEFPESYIYALICYVEKKHGYKSRFKKSTQSGIWSIVLKIAILIFVFFTTPLLFNLIFTEYNFINIFKGSAPTATFIYLFLYLIGSIYFGNKAGIFLFNNIKFTTFICLISFSSYFLDYRFQIWQREKIFNLSYTEINRNGKVIPRKLNVREYNSINSSILFKLKKGEHVFVIGKMNSSEWYLINFEKGNKTGYVSSKLIELEK